MQGSFSGLGSRHVRGFPNAAEKCGWGCTDHGYMDRGHTAHGCTGLRGEGKPPVAEAPLPRPRLQRIVRAYSAPEEAAGRTAFKQQCTYQQHAQRFGIRSQAGSLPTLTRAFVSHQGANGSWSCRRPVAGLRQTRLRCRVLRAGGFLSRDPPFCYRSCFLSAGWYRPPLFVDQGPLSMAPIGPPSRPGALLFSSDCSTKGVSGREATAPTFSIARTFSSGWASDYRWFIIGGDSHASMQ